MALFNIKYKSLVDIILPTKNPKASKNDFLKKGEIFFIQEETPSPFKRYPVKYKLLNRNQFFWMEMETYLVDFIKNNKKLFKEMGTFSVKK